MKKLFITLTILISASGCGNQQEFSQELWKLKTGDLPYENREKVIDDLVQNHLKEGIV